MSAENSSAPPSTPKKSSLLLKILLVLLLSAGAFAAYVAAQPNDFRVERTTTIAAAPDAVYGQVANFRQWDHWSPWAKLDPNAQNTFEGPESGQGAVFKWSGNDQVGEGGMTITEVRPPEHVKIRLDFEKPMKDTSNVEFLLQPAGDQTKVTWIMSGRHQNFIGKAFCTVMNMEKMIGDKYEEGLASLKKVVENAPQPAQNSSETPSTDTQGS